MIENKKRSSILVTKLVSISLQRVEKEDTIMVTRSIFGNPIETDAVLTKPSAVAFQNGEMEKKEDGFYYTMKDEDIVYGLGENVRGINKRGWKYISSCNDDPVHSEEKRSLYGAHNFILISGKKNIGIFVDTPGKVTFDIGYTKYDTIHIQPETDDFELYIIENDTPDAVITEFRGLIGKSYIPPKWAFGYGQSRWSYFTSDEVREVVKKHRENHIPIDSLYLDIDYMERYKDFTINPDSFADFDELVKEMKEQHIHLVPIIDAGVKKEDGYDVYEEGKANNYFCKDADGNDFVVGVWPGKCCFPDMLNDEAREWFGNKYKVLLDKGIDGFWNDMNEPAIFYSEKRMDEVFEKLAEYGKMNLDVQTFFACKDLVLGMSNNEEDYASFYHNYKGQKVCHKDVHNLFGYYMTRSASEAFDRIVPDKRVLMYSRASYIGMHRYSGIWQGDNMSWWSHLLMNIKMMPSLNMCGFLYTGADLGGFGADVTEDLMIRWLSFGVFTPLMRNHSANGTRRQEVYQFENTKMFRDILSVRYKLIPYLYSEYMKAALNDTMMFRPLGFVYGKDEIARTVENQLMIGDNVMVAPVYEQNAIGRVVYFPETMKMIRFSQGNVTEEQVYEKGHHYIKMPLGDICIFIREGYILPIAEGGEYVDEVKTDSLKLYACGETPAAYALYEDDGTTKEYDMANCRMLTL